jgi:RNA polymerase sigma-70 factor (ECF subfamily)
LDENFPGKLDKSSPIAHPVNVMHEPKLFADRVRLLANRISESSGSALSGLYDLTAQRLVRYGTTITRNQHDAEDAVQSTLVKVAVHPELLCRSAQPWPYLLRMVRNEALVILRRKQRWSLVGNLSDLLTRRNVDELDQEDTHRAVWAALRTLPTEQSEVVVLKIWEEMKFVEIGQILDISPSTAASRYRYAMEKLEEKLRVNRDAEVFNDSE